MINDKGGAVKIGMANYGMLTLTDVNFKSGPYVECMINNRGKLTLAGTTTIENGQKLMSGIYLAITNDPYNAHYTDFDASLNVASPNVTVGNVQIERYGNNTNSGSIVLNITSGSFGKFIEDGDTKVAVEGNITGGIFSENISADYCAGGFESVETNGIYIVETAGDIASVNGTACRTLIDLMAVVNAQGSNPTTITFLKDFQLAMALAIQENQDITLNLDGHTITAVLDTYMIKNKGKLTITGNGTAYNTCNIRQGCGEIRNEETGTLIIENGTFGLGTTEGTRGIAVWNFGTATLNGGSYTACDNYNNGGYAYALVNGAGTMTIGKDVVVEGKMNGALGADGGKIIVNGGKFTLGDGTTSNNFYMLYTWQGEIEVADGEFVRNTKNDYGFIYGGGKVSISGGSYEDKVNNHIKVVNDTVISDGKFTGNLVKADDVTLSVSGGIFTEKVPAEYCAEGFEPTENADGTFGVAPIENQISANVVDAVTTETDGTTTGTIRFITKVDQLTGTPTSFGTYMLPFAVFEKEGLAEGLYAVVQYNNQAIKTGETYAADLTGVPGEYLGAKIYAKSFMIIQGEENALTCEFEATSVNEAAAQ